METGNNIRRLGGAAIGYVLCGCIVVFFVKAIMDATGKALVLEPRARIPFLVGSIIAVAVGVYFNARHNHRYRHSGTSEDDIFNYGWIGSGWVFAIYTWWLLVSNEIDIIRRDYDKAQEDKLIIPAIGVAIFFIVRDHLKRER